MTVARKLRFSLTSLQLAAAWAAVVGLILTPLPAAAQQPGADAPVQWSPAIEVGDVALDSTGSLRGVVVDAEGAPVTSTPVTLHQGDALVARADSDAQSGGFAFEQLRGGVYQVSAAGGSAMVRVWSDGTAPPAASEQVLLVAGDPTRGQNTFGHHLDTQTLIVAAIIAAAITIPIAIHNSQRSKKPAS